jgi:hypothetical protein
MLRAAGIHNNKTNGAASHYCLIAYMPDPGNAMYVQVGRKRAHQLLAYC